VINMRHFLTKLTFDDIKFDINNFATLLKDYNCKNQYHAKAQIDLLTCQALLILHVEKNEAD